jgi:chemotaxis signal transduction protein
MSSTLKTGNQTAKLLKILVFKVGHLYLGLQIESVEKVINYTPIYGSGLSDLGIAHVGDQEITVIDLHRKLFNQDQSYQEGYLIIIQNSQGESFAVLAEDTPSLIEIPLSNLRILPESYRHGDTLAIASHVTMIEQENQKITVFLLDRDQII